MKKIYPISLIMLVCLWVFTACHSEKVEYQTNGQTGQVNLGSMVIDPQTEPMVSISRVIADKNDFVVGIYSESNELVKEWIYRDMPDVFTLKVGNYKIKAHSPEVEGAVFDVPYCAGESNVFEIAQDQITEVGEVKCTLHNVKVTVKYSESLKPHLGDDFKATVSVGGESLAYTKEETRSGFFHGEATGNIVNVVLSGKIEGEEADTHLSYSNIDLGTELILTLNWQGVNGDPGTGGSVIAPEKGISINGECISVDEEAILLPDEDEILDFGNPKIEGEGFDIKEPITDLNQPVVVLLSAPEGIAHIMVQIVSDNVEFSGVIQEMFGTEPFDLAYPGDLEETLTGLKFPIGDQVINQQTVRFDVSEFIPLLSEFPGKHEFKLTVKDNTGSAQGEVHATLTVISSQTPQ